MSRTSRNSRAKAQDKHVESLAAAVENMILAMEMEDLGGVESRFADLADLFHQAGRSKASLDGRAMNALMGKLVQLGYCPQVEPDESIGDMCIGLERWSGTGPNIIVKLLSRDDESLDYTLDEIAQVALMMVHEERSFAGFEGETILYGIAHDAEGCAAVMEKVRFGRHHAVRRSQEKTACVHRTRGRHV